MHAGGTSSVRTLQLTVIEMHLWMLLGEFVHSDSPVVTDQQHVIP